MLARRRSTGSSWNSYFVVAHFHYVIVGGILFALFARLLLLVPKVSGRMLSETLGRLHFLLFLIGFHLTFDFMHIPGLLGMPRRIYTYEPGRGWDIWNLIVTVGAFFQGAAILVFVATLCVLLQGSQAGNDPWDAWTLEWATSSPPPGLQLRGDSCRREPPAALGSESTRRIRTADTSERKRVMNARCDAARGTASHLELPTRGHVGMVCLIAAEAAIFMIFVVAYIFYIGKSLTGPMPSEVSRRRSSSRSACCRAASPFTSPSRPSNAASSAHFSGWWLSTIALGGLFLYGTAREWHRLIYEDGLTISTNLFGTTYYSLVGLHGFHVIVGLVLLSTVMALRLAGRVGHEHAYRVDVLSLYWHFVDAVWVVVFTVVYIIGR